MAATHPTPQESLALVVHRPVKSRLRLIDLWETRAVARMLGVRDIKAKYKQAALGPLWLVIAPFGMLFALSIAFSGVTKVDTAGASYFIFALIGLTVWSFIQLSASLGAQAIITNSVLVRRSPLPRVSFITGSLIGNFPPIIIMFATAMVATIITRGLPIQALLLPLLIAWLLIFTLGVSLLLASLAARFRDTVSALPLIIQAGIFVSPVGYSMHNAPANIKTLLTINPVSGLIEAWRWAMLDLHNVQWTAIGIAGVWTVIVATLGWRIFARLEVSFADYV